MSCIDCKQDTGGQGTYMLTFNVVAGEAFTRQVGEYGICSGYAFFGIQGEIDLG
jgi:hypothetical protein